MQARWQFLRAYSAPPVPLLGRNASVSAERLAVRPLQTGHSGGIFHALRPA